MFKSTSGCISITMRSLQLVMSPFSCDFIKAVIKVSTVFNLVIIITCMSTLLTQHLVFRW